MGSPNRPPFQIHLSTAIILSLEIAVLMWANFSSGTTKMWSGNPRMPDDTVLLKVCGWPVKSFVTETPCGHPKKGEYVYGRAEIPAMHSGIFGILVDLAVAVLILGFTYCFCERKHQDLAKTLHRSWFRVHFLTVVILGLIFIVPFYYFVGESGFLNLCQAELFLVIVLSLFEYALYNKIAGPELFAF